MYLAKISVANFRCFGPSGITVDFVPGMNVIIGENNVGKTALVDVLRILFSLGPGRRDVYATIHDLYCSPTGETATEMRIDATFDGLTPEEEGAFFELLAPTNPLSAQIHLRFRLEDVKGQQRLRQTIWGGEMEGQAISGQTHELISHVYLEALRDAEKDLGPGRASQLSRLVRRVIVDKAERDRIVEHANAANAQILGEPGVKRSTKAINSHLAALAGPRLSQEIRIGFTPPVFERVSELLRPLLPFGGSRRFRVLFEGPDWEALLKDAGGAAEKLRAHAKQDPTGRVALDLTELTDELRSQLPDATLQAILSKVPTPFGVEHNGMGYNNLIYMGIVLGDLVERRRADAHTYNALVIEEPEAHLHPQLQLLVYDFLDRTGVVDVEHSKIQVFITSHSPTLTAKANLDNVVVLQRTRADQILATALRHCPLSQNDKLDLKRYVDVTRSQLFFAQAVVLVEGISEAFLLPVFAKRLGQRLDHAAVEVVGVCGVSFLPFARLFNAEDQRKRLNIPCAVVTDDDRCSTKGGEDVLSVDDMPSDIAAKLKRGTPSSRCTNIAEQANGMLAVTSATKTLEFELGREATNIPAIVEALKRSGHPKKAEKLAQNASLATDDWHRGALAWLELAGVKAEVAQSLACLLEEKSGDQYTWSFTVPAYIEEALKHLWGASSV